MKRDSGRPPVATGRSNTKTSGKRTSLRRAQLNGPSIKPCQPTSRPWRGCRTTENGCSYDRDAIIYADRHLRYPRFCRQNPGELDEQVAERQRNAARWAAVISCAWLVVGFIWTVAPRVVFVGRLRQSRQTGSGRGVPSNMRTHMEWRAGPIYAKSAHCSWLRRVSRRSVFASLSVACTGFGRKIWFYSLFRSLSRSCSLQGEPGMPAMETDLQARVHCAVLSTRVRIVACGTTRNQLHRKDMRMRPAKRCACEILSDEDSASARFP